MYYDTYRELITSLYITPQKKILALVLHLLLCSCFIVYIDFRIYPPCSKLELQIKESTVKPYTLSFVHLYDPAA